LTARKGEANEPNVYYPNGKRNYVSVPADDLQGTLAANSKSLSEKGLYPGRSRALRQGIADIFEATAKRRRYLDEGIDPKAADYKALMTKIKVQT